MNLLKKALTFILCFSLCTLTGCSSTKEIPENEKGDDTKYTYKLKFNSLDNDDLLKYMEDSVYYDVIEQLNSEEYFVENVETKYISDEYIEELEYNSQSNIFFGYTLEEIESTFNEDHYVFTLDENGNTAVQATEDYVNIYPQIIKDVAIGSGVILTCITISTLTAGTAPAISLIFAASASTGTKMALSGGAISAATTAIVKGIQTGNVEESLKSAAISGAEGFKMGAISGAAIGGTVEGALLKSSTFNGLTMNEAALIQKESKFPKELIWKLHSMDEYEAIADTGVQSQFINGKLAMINYDAIDLKLVDEYGRTNLERMMSGLAPLDDAGKSFELHHLGQESDGLLVALTQAQHDNKALHGFKKISEINRPEFAKIRSKFWKTVANIMQERGY